MSLDLAPELWLHVISFLDLSSLARASRVCAEWAALIEETPWLYQRLLLQDYRHINASLIDEREGGGGKKRWKELLKFVSRTDVGTAWVLHIHIFGMAAVYQYRHRLMPFAMQPLNTKARGYVARGTAPWADFDGVAIQLGAYLAIFQDYLEQPWMTGFLTRLEPSANTSQGYFLSCWNNTTGYVVLHRDEIATKKNSFGLIPIEQLSNESEDEEEEEEEGDEDDEEDDDERGRDRREDEEERFGFRRGRGYYEESDSDDSDAELGFNPDEYVPMDIDSNGNPIDPPKSSKDVRKALRLQREQFTMGCIQQIAAHYNDLEKMFQPLKVLAGTWKFRFEFGDGANTFYVIIAEHEEGTFFGTIKDERNSRSRDVLIATYDDFHRKKEGGYFADVKDPLAPFTIAMFVKVSTRGPDGKPVKEMYAILAWSAELRIVESQIEGRREVRVLKGHVAKVAFSAGAYVTDLGSFTASGL